MNTVALGSGSVVLRRGREKSVRLRHPWVFSGAIRTVSDGLTDGDSATIYSSENEVLGTGYVNRRSQISVRMLAFGEAVEIGPAFWRERLRKSVERRGDRRFGRFVNAESDGLPGLTLDRYHDVWVLQISTLGMERVREQVREALGAVVEPATLYERSDVDGRKKEGLEPRVGLLSGREPPERLEIEEPSARAAVRVLVDVRRGHKTGAYLDQSENRRRVALRCDQAHVLNLFSFTGGFGIHAAVGGASRVVNVDSSSEALAVSSEIAALNGVEGVVEHRRGNVFEVVRVLAAASERFDAVIVDPPKLVRSASHLAKGTRAYKDLNRLALSLLRQGGYLATFSCSGLVPPALFQKIVFSAALEAGRDVQIIERFTHPEDHPVLLSFPEGEYLKGLGCRVL